MELIACFYLLLRRSNVFAPDVTPSARLRRWTITFFALMFLSHMWYLPVVFFTSPDAIRQSQLVGVLLDSMTVIPLIIVLLICMLQDRRRPLWPVAVMVAPLALGLVACLVSHNDAYMPLVLGYFLLMCIGILIFMVIAVRQYGRWLRDNYADLEHKEVWQTFVVLAVIVLMLGYYVVGYDGGMFYEYVIQVCGIVLVGHLLWRVETLSDLSGSGIQEDEETRRREYRNTGIQEDGNTGIQEGDAGPSPDTLSDDAYEEMTLLLQKHCIDTGLYLQHDLNKAQVAQAIGTNRTYLSLYFMRQETTYNAYINDLRIRHFIRLYREAIAAERPVTAQQLALMSGYRSYSTFSLAFKQRMDQSVTAWMRREKIEAGKDGN